MKGGFGLGFLPPNLSHANPSPLHMPGMPNQPQFHHSGSHSLMESTLPGLSMLGTGTRLSLSVYILLVEIPLAPNPNGSGHTTCSVDPSHRKANWEYLPMEIRIIPSGTWHSALWFRWHGGDGSKVGLDGLGGVFQPE